MTQNGKFQVFSLKNHFPVEKKILSKLQRDQGWAISHEEKEQVAHEYCSRVMGIGGDEHKSLSQSNLENLTERIKMPKRGMNWAFLKINCKN
jgi:hypothetical protein